MRRRLAVAVALLALPACAGSASLPDAVEGTVTVPPTSAAPTFPTCSPQESADVAAAVRSYDPLSPMPPPGEMPAGSTMATIQQRGRMIIGVSADTLLFGSRNPLTGKIEGFDIDMLKEVALAIFGGSYDDVDQHLEYKVITYAQRLPALEAGPDHGGVDIVAHTMTINCTRWKRIAFSSMYFDAGQKVLVKKGSDFTGIAALNTAGARVCAPEGSTNIDLLRNDKQGYGRIRIVPKPDITDCLVALQQGEADGLTGDDTVLAGLSAQDPNTEVVGDKFTQEPYGLGINKQDVEFVRFVNGVLEQIRANGRWKQIYATWLTGILPDTDPPAPTYGR